MEEEVKTKFLKSHITLYSCVTVFIKNHRKNREWIFVRLQYIEDNKKDNILLRKNIPGIKHSGKFYWGKYNAKMKNFQLKKVKAVHGNECRESTD